jgi:hypothetical protein
MAVFHHAMETWKSEFWGQDYGLLHGVPLYGSVPLSDWLILHRLVLEFGLRYSVLGFDCRFLLVRLAFDLVVNVWICACYACDK